MKLNLKDQFAHRPVATTGKVLGCAFDAFWAVALIPALLSSCSALPPLLRNAQSSATPPIPPVAPAPTKVGGAVNVQQLPGTTRFAACEDDCLLPTPKTVGPAMVAIADTAPAIRMAAVRPPSLPTDVALSVASAPDTPTPVPVKPAWVAPAPIELSVLFPMDSAVLPTSEQNRLRNLAKVFQRARTIKIDGRTDSMGTQEANDRVASARALAVMLFIRDNVLKEDGSARPDLQAQWKGKCCYAATNDNEAGRIANRRAQITVEQAAQTPVPLSGSDAAAKNTATLASATVLRPGAPPAPQAKPAPAPAAKSDQTAVAPSTATTPQITP